MLQGVLACAVYMQLLISGIRCAGCAWKMQLCCLWSHLLFVAAVRMAWRKAPVHPPQ